MVWCCFGLCVLPIPLGEGGSSSHLQGLCPSRDVGQRAVEVDSKAQQGLAGARPLRCATATATATAGGGCDRTLAARCGSLAHSQGLWQWVLGEPVAVASTWWQWYVVDRQRGPPVPQCLPHSHHTYAHITLRWAYT